MLKELRSEEEQREAVERVLRAIAKAVAKSRNGDALTALGISAAEIIEHTIEPELWAATIRDLHSVIIGTLYGCDGEADHGAMN